MCQIPAVHDHGTSFTGFNSAQVHTVIGLTIKLFPTLNECTATLTVQRQI